MLILLLFPKTFEPAPDNNLKEKYYFNPYILILFDISLYLINSPKCWISDILTFLHFFEF